MSRQRPTPSTISSAPLAGCKPRQGSDPPDVSRTWTPGVFAIQDIQLAHLTDDADWEAIAKWCGGQLTNHEDPSGEYHTELVIPRPGRRPLSAVLDDILARTGVGTFIVYERKEDPDETAWWAKQADVAAREDKALSSGY